MSNMTPENVAGLVVGEGCFYVESGRDTKYRLGWRIRPAFCIEMRSDERDVLEGVQQNLSCGHIYDLDFGRYRNYEARGWRPHVKYRCSKLEDLKAKVIPFFQANQLFGTKKQAFEIFSSIVEMKHARELETEEGLAKAKLLAEQLTKHNKKG